jgi:hypothetical protein
MMRRRLVVPTLLIALWVMALPSIAAALGPNTAQELKDRPGGYRWEQVILEDKIRIRYNPEDFYAGGDAARIQVIDTTKGVVKIRLRTRIEGSSSSWSRAEGERSMKSA